MKQLSQKKTHKKALVQFHAVFTIITCHPETYSDASEAIMSPHVIFKSGRDKYYEELLFAMETDGMVFKEKENDSVCFNDEDVAGTFFSMHTYYYNGIQASWAVTKRGDDCVILMKICHEYHLLVFKRKARRRRQVLIDLIAGKLTDRLPGKKNPAKTLFMQLFDTDLKQFSDTVSKLHTIHTGTKKEVPAVKAVLSLHPLLNSFNSR